MITAKIIYVPEVLIRYMQSFLTHDDYHMFMNTSKYYFGELKKQTIYFKLNCEMSLIYCQDEIFQEILLSKVANGWKQISLQFHTPFPKFSKSLPIHSIQRNAIGFSNYSPDEIDYVSHIECVLGLMKVHFIPPIPMIKKLSLEECFLLEDVTNLSHLSYLYLFGARIRDFSPLKDISCLSIVGCDQLTDFSIFSSEKQKELYLTSCPHLIDVTPFRMIHTLKLLNCKNIEDVSPLYGIYDLCLQSCPKVSDISRLGGHHSLQILTCAQKLKGYQALLYVPQVSLSDCDIKDLNVLRFAKSVRLNFCHEKLDVTPLKDVRKVSLVYCNSIFNVYTLEHVSHLELEGFDAKDIGLTYLRNRSLTLYSIDKIIPDPSFLQYIIHLELMEVYGIGKTLNQLNLQNLQSLRLSCGSLTHVNGFGSIPNLYLEYCERLTDISGLGQNHSVRLFFCHDLRRVDSLATVPVVTIEDCRSIEDYDCLNLVPRLKIKRYESN